ncbi:MAG: hypothetical protein Q8P41_08100 [Pseudomonadota bacterium]|nr:hypothetical protein [Pseudomonadota bacterium]
MRWQDETPITELIVEGVNLEGAYLTVARVGEDRKEAQIGSQPIEGVVDAREWLDGVAVGALGTGSDVRLRIRLWNADRTPVRGITTRVWPDAEAPADEGAPDRKDDDTDEGVDARRSSGLVVRRPATITKALPHSVPVRRERAVATPTYASPCPTCASASTTVALLQSRISELSAMLGTAQTAVRDARRDAEDAQKSSLTRGRRAKDAEAELSRLRAENAELLDAVRRLRRENRELNEGAAEILAAASRFTG